ncbi:MAG: tripartite tricarboxylate transporter substrate binding protein [Proteobacteria bacterium]|nr:tripartite tricarboxylate transporter substrate binding protein [Pseudomonadota bacterium]
MNNDTSLRWFSGTLAAALLCCATGSGAVMAQDYPSRPVRIVVPFPAGGTTDIIGRIVGQRLTRDWKQQVLIDNRPGGGANIGAELAMRAAADGYTLFMASTAHSINATLYPKLAYDPVRDFTAISMMADTAQVLVVHPSLPVKDVRGLIALLKQRPGDLSYSSAGNGSQPHLSAEMFRMLTGTRMTHIPYKGGPQAMTDLIAGFVALSFATAPSAVPHVKSGKVRALGVSSLVRIPALPQVPTIDESGLAGFEANNVFGMVGPPGLPAALVERINADLVAALKDPGIRGALSEQGAEARPSTPAEYAALIRNEVTNWGKVVRQSGARVD